MSLSIYDQPVVVTDPWGMVGKTDFSGFIYARFEQDFSNMSEVSYIGARIIKYNPLFFGHQEEFFQPYFIRDNKIIIGLFLLELNDNYYVFLNTQVQSYVEKTVPIFREFSTFESAEKFYEEVNNTISFYSFPEDFFKSFNVTIWYGCQENVEKCYEKALISINDNQSIMVNLKKCVGRNIKINDGLYLKFKNNEQRDACWEAMKGFFDKFEIMYLSELSDQLFIQDFLNDVFKHCVFCDNCEKHNRKISKITAYGICGDSNSNFVFMYNRYTPFGGPYTIHFNDNCSITSVSHLKEILHDYLQEEGKGNREADWMKKYVKYFMPIWGKMLYY